MTYTLLPPHRPLLVAAASMILFLAGCMGAIGHSEAAPPAPILGQWSNTGAKAPSLVLTLGDPATSKVRAWTPQFDNVPATYDINGDGVKEIIAHGMDRKVYVFSATTGQVLAVLPTTYPPAWHIERIMNGVEVGVLRPGAPPSIVITNHAAYVSVWNFDAVESTQDSFTFHLQWEHRMDACYRSPGMDAEAVLADLNGDGQLEIIVQTEELGFFALNADGTTRWKHCWAGGNSAPVVDDLDGYGKPSVIVASDSGFISVLDGDTGAPQWTFDAGDHIHGIIPASVPAKPTVAELDGKWPKEILFTARYAPTDDPDQYGDFNMAIFAIHQDRTTWQGEVLWMRQPEWANPMSNTRLVVHDVDGNGKPDIFGMDWNTIGHIPGEWERLGPANVFRLNERGEDVWVRQVDAWWSNQDILLSDSDGDGQWDILVNGPGGGGDGLWRLSAATGAAEGFFGFVDWKLLRGATMADLHGDGSMHLIFPVAPFDASDKRGAILVFKLVDSAKAA